MMLPPKQSVVWVVGLMLAAMPQFASAQRSEVSEVESAIERLWSVDEDQARTAKERLVDLGASRQYLRFAVSRRQGARRRDGRGQTRGGR